MPVGRRANREKNDSGLRRRLEVGSRACGCTVGGEPVAGNNDRYAIRTRNLQDWNLTRYRCANRSKVSAHEDAAAVRLEGDLAQAASAASGAALRWLLMPLQRWRQGHFVHNLLHSVTPYKCGFAHLFK